MRQQLKHVSRSDRPAPLPVEMLEERRLCSAGIVSAAMVAAEAPAGPPTVELIARPVVRRGTSFDFKVRYSSAAGMDPASVGDDDVHVLSWNQETTPATVVRTRSRAHGRRLVVRYRMNAPDGVFDAADNGEYGIILAVGGVIDRAGAPAPGGALGVFNVDSKLVIPPPVVPDWLPAGPTASAGALSADLTSLLAYCDHELTSAGGSQQFLGATVVLTNAGGTPLEVTLDHCYLSFAADQLGPDETGVSIQASSGLPSGEKTLILQPGESRTVSFRGAQVFPENHHGDTLYATMQFSAGGLTLAVRASTEVLVVV